MIQWLKTWINPPIMQYGIPACPVCNRTLKKQLNIFQKRRCQMFKKYDDVFTFICGRCKGRSEWCGTEGNPQPFVMLRITWPINRMVYQDVLNLAQDAQARHNIALIQNGQYHPKPDRTLLSQLGKKELLKYVKRIEQQIKNIKKIKIYH